MTLSAVAGPAPRALLVTLCLGALGGLVAHALHMPLGYLLGALLVTAPMAALRVRPFGLQITAGPRLRLCFVPVIGVAIGGAFTPEVLSEAGDWLVSLAALCLFVPLLHATGYAIYRRGGLDRTTALFGAVPGGLIESVQFGEEAGADVALLTLLQFLRLIGTIIAVPVIFWIATGHTVGSGSGVQMVGSGAALGLRDAILLALAGLLGATSGKMIRLPGAIITGPIIASSAIHALGLVEGVPPGWLLAVTQIVIGSGLGARFAGTELRVMRRAALLAVINGAVALGIALVFALALQPVVSEPTAAIFLAFAPGGLAEMGLIALSLNLSVIYVTAHHVTRIVLAVGLAQIGRTWARNAPSKG